MNEPLVSNLSWLELLEHIEQLPESSLRDLLEECINCLLVTNPRTSRGLSYGT